MFEMLLDTALLFFKGKLFKDNKQFARQLLLGAAIAAVGVVVASVAGAQPLASACVGGVIGGFSQPVLFKNLKFR